MTISQAQPTPGPWEHADNGLIYGQGSDEDEALFVCDVIRDSTMQALGILSLTEQANARLIAVAPELLELARQIILAKDTDESIPVDLYHAAARIIAKAELE